MGIPASWVLALSFGLGTMLAAISGGLISTLFPFTVLAGARYELKSFVICVLGGLGNPLGALIGGLLLGALEGVIPVLGSIPGIPSIETTWVPVIEFVLFVIILLVKPSGLLGRES
jgi:branched-subunit amino acid ABC-type transport system permease component